MRFLEKGGNNIMSSKLEIKVNKNWDKKTPFLTVMTPVYNRKVTLPRTIKSVDGQTFRDIEYIIIDDGSKESVDDIVEKFMDSTDIPVMFVKKNNGGVHTARNVGYKQARGELILCIDSDDELLPDACEIFYKTWRSISEEERKEYWQIKAQLVDQNGDGAGAVFPNNINKLPKEKAWRYFSMAKGDQIGCRVTHIMKKNLFPEPDEVTFVTENIRWIPLERKYRSWGVNKVVGICHREGNDHLSKGLEKKTKQDLRNMFWNMSYQLNNSKLYALGFCERLNSISKYCVLVHLLKKCNDDKFIDNNKLKKNGFNMFWKSIFWFPSIVVANNYYNRRIK